MVDVVTQNLQNRKAAANTTYEGPTTADYLANPLYPELDRDQVLAVALQYIGTPYVHGGEDPSKFDCSGLITFVYAQFGIELTHYVPTQNTEGRTIPASEAVPGDLVVFDNLAHDGIYAGNGMILDAPKPGGFVDVRPIWNQAHHFVRIDG
nr:C40 family peptidase [Frigoribacterium sp. VKM Ac-2836]